MKNNLFLSNEDIDSFLHAIRFMSNVALGETTQVDYFTDEEINKILNSLQEGIK